MSTDASSAAASTTSPTKNSQHEEALRRNEKLMAAAGIPPLRIKYFLNTLRSLQAGVSTKISERDLVDVAPVVDNFDESTPQPSDEESRELLAQTVILKLNGGLGTTMGLADPKAIIEVRDGKSIFDIMAAQLELLRERNNGVPVRTMFMNSFVSAAPTVAFIVERPELLRDCVGLKPTDPMPDREHAAALFTERCDLRQGMVPKVLPDTLLPASEVAPEATDDATAAATRFGHAWCPPGHGDFWLSLVSTGRLDELLKEGKRYMFISNIDNVAATVDVRLPHKMKTEGIDFLLEAAKRTPIDVKGSHVAKLRSGALVVRELSQCLPQEQDEFYNVQKHCFFNTNSIWVDLVALKDVLAKSPEGYLELPTTLNNKTLNPTDPSTPKVIQLESPVAAAIKHFPKAKFVCIPRDRFSPIKHTTDLFCVRSDAYDFNSCGGLSCVAAAPPRVALDSCYAHYDAFQRTIGAGATPSLRKCSRLTIVGPPMQFAEGTVIEGDVDIRVRVEEQRPGQGASTMPVLKAGVYKDRELTV